MIGGTITLADSTEIEISDSLLVNNALSISMSTCSESMFDIGTFNAAVLKMSIIDDDVLLHKFDNARIDLSEISGETETALGTYWVDSTKTKRKKNNVMLTATDAAAKFDSNIDDTIRSAEYTALTALTAACTAAGVALYNNDLSDFPNYNVTFSVSSSSVQTYRDLVMWTAQLLCANAIINRSGQLEIRRARYQENEESIVVDKYCTGTDRADIQFSDIRTYIKYLTYYSGNDPMTHTVRIVDPQDEQIRDGMFTLPYNPLLEGKTPDECDSINSDLHMYIGSFLQRQVKAKMFVDTTVQLGSTICFRGGKIDIRRSIIGVVTKITWKYRGLMEVICTAPAAAKGEAE